MATTTNVRHSRRRGCLVALLAAAVSCGGPPYNSYDPPPSFAMRLLTDYPDLRSRYSGSQIRGERVIDLTDDPMFSPLGNVYSTFGYVNFGAWTAFEGARWPATWIFYTTAGCGQGSSTSGEIRHKLIDIKCVPRPAGTSVNPTGFSASSPPGALTLTFDGNVVPGGTTAAIWIVDNSNVIAEYDTTIWNAVAEVPVPALGAGHYYVIADFASLPDVDGGVAEFDVFGSVPSTLLYGGQTLGPGNSVTSPNGRFALTYQPDGNLVLYDYGSAVWAINCWPTCSDLGPAGYATMQQDGNFVVYNGSGTPVFHTGTWGNGGAYLAVGDDGSLIVHDSSGSPLWSR